MTTVIADDGARPLSKWVLPTIWVALTAALIFAMRNLPWARVLSEIRHVHAGWIFAAVAANLAILPLWALEWRVLLPGTIRVAFRTMFEVVAVTAAVLNSIPFLAGEASGVALLISRVGLTRGAALSVLAMDQLLVGFAKLAVIAAAAIYAPLPAWLRSGLLSLAIAMAALVLILLPLAHYWRTIRDRLASRPSKARLLAAHIAEWGTHFDVLRERHRAWRVAFLALAKKTAELLAILAIQAAFGLEPSIANGLLVLTALAITTLLPVTPANLGVYEATVFAIYRYIGIPIETALGLAIVQHICFLLPALTTGYVAITLRQLLPRPQRAS